MKVRHNYHRLVAVCWIFIIFLTVTEARSTDRLIGMQESFCTPTESPYTLDNKENSERCIPQFEANHLSILCRELADNRQLPTPLIKTDCRTIVQYEYQDQYFDLGCSVSSFSGYFDPARWTSSEVQGAGGVDVTGAPSPQLLVEGTDNSLLEVANGRQTWFKLVIPASGFITFEWDLLGSSTTTTATRTNFLQVQVNQKSTTLNTQSTTFFRTPYLHAGDILQIQLIGDHKVAIRDFQFSSNASAIIERHWTASDQEGSEVSHVQYIAIERPNLSNITMPLDQVLEMDFQPESLRSIHPNQAGFPYFDKDGDEETTNDRIILEPGSCDLDILWEDELEFTPTGIVILRRWQLMEPCLQNRLEKTQTIELFFGKDISAFPLDLLQEYLYSKPGDQQNWSINASYKE